MRDTDLVRRVVHGAMASLVLALIILLSYVAYTWDQPTRDWNCGQATVSLPCQDLDY